MLSSTPILGTPPLKPETTLKARLTGMVENAGTGYRIRIPDTDTGYGYRIRIPDTDTDTDTGYGYRIVLNIYF